MSVIDVSDLRALVEASSTILVSCERDGVVRAINPVGASLLGWDADELIGRVTPDEWLDAVELSAEADRLSRELHREVRPTFETLAASAGRNSSTWTLVRRDGSRFPARLEVSVRSDERGQVVG